MKAFMDAIELPRPMGPSQARVVEKPWGREIIFAETEAFAGKILHIRGGERLSLQLHRYKQEFLHLLEGEATILLGETQESLTRYRLKPNDVVEVPRGCIHRVEAERDCIFMEASSPELDDIVRLHDDYGRS